MEQNFVVKRSSGDQQSCESFSKASLPQLSQSTTLRGKSKQEKSSLSYADHHEITTNVKDCTSIGSKNQEKEHVSGKLLKEEEIIKYMSNLPTYLERRSNFQEKGLNVGVLDWERLEKWHSGQKQIPCENSVSSSSGSTSAFSTIESSLYSRKGHTSPGRLRVHRPSLQSPVVISPAEVGVKNQDHKPLRSNTFNGKQKVIGADQSSSKYSHYIESELLKRNCLVQKVVPEKMKQIGELTKIEDKQQILDSGDIWKVPETDCFWNGDVPEINGVEIPVLKDSRLSLTEACQKDIVERSSTAGKSELNSEIPHPCQISCEGSRKNVLVVQPSMSGLKGTKPTFETSHSVKQSAARGVTPAKTSIFHGTKAIGAPADSRENKSSSGMDLAESKVSVEKTRSFSPFSRLNIGFVRRSKGSSSMDESDIPHQSSEKISVKPKSENSTASTNLDASSNDKRKSSPLRRLLDPILGLANYRHKKSLERDSIEKNVKASNLLSESSTVQSVKVKLDISRCRKIDVNDAAQDKKRGPTSAQALLQAAVKNGLPLLTFAVDNVSDVLAATMKLTSLGKEKYRIYTLFTIREVKKKNGSWINQGGKAKGRDYISNVVAQMKVSELQFSNLTRLDEFCVREFILFSVDRKHSDQQMSDFPPINELAAIVIKIPFSVSTRNGLQRDALNDLAKTDSNVLFSGVKSYSSSRANVGSLHSLGSETSISTTVILPSGNHSLPSKGGPSSLIERWNTGGTCDCGGWDLGCKLRIFTSSNQVTKKSSSSENYSLIDQLLLFPQEGEVDNQPVLSMTMLKDKIFSIEFGSSLTHLQAFSISIALLDSRNLCDFSFEEKTLDESRAAQYGKLMTSNRVGEVSCTSESASFSFWTSLIPSWSYIGGIIFERGLQISSEVNVLGRKQSPLI